VADQSIRARLARLAEARRDRRAREVAAAEEARKKLIGPRGERGEPGEPGARGEPGERGPVGRAGADGRDGHTGERGERGPTGRAGAIGAVGPAGKDGLPGPPGPKGDRGPQGRRGDKGDKGDKGDTGERGERGEKGERGERGPPGKVWGGGRAIVAPGGSGDAVLAFGSKTVAATAGPRYLAPWSSDTLAQKIETGIRVPRGGTLRDLRVAHGRPAGNGGAITYTVRVNGWDSALIVAVASSNPLGTDTAHSAIVAAGDVITIRVDKSAIGESPRDVLATLRIS